MFQALYVLATLASIQTAPLTQADVVPVPGPAGKYDFLAADGRLDRIIGAHAGVGGISILDLKTKTVINVPGPKVNGVVVDAKDNRIFAAGPDKKLMAVDRTSLQVVGTVDLDGPGDGMAFDSTNGELYVDEDDGTHAWVFNPLTLKLIASVDIAGAPEWIEYDRTNKCIFQNIKTPNVLQKIDPIQHKAVATWTMTGSVGPHGMALDPKAGKAYSAGKNGVLLQVNMTTGAIEATVNIAKGVDQICIDRKLKRIYCACGGTISIVDSSNGTLKSLGEIKGPQGAGNLIVDQKTHDVWMAGANKDSGFFVRFTAVGGA